MNSVDGIPGWFDFQEVYERAVQCASESNRASHTFVECGALFGASSRYFAEAMDRMSTKSFNLHVVDIFTDSVEPPDPLQEQVIKFHGSCRAAFDHYTRRFSGLRSGVSVTVHQRDSIGFARDFEPETQFDFVFLDSDHAYDHIRGEIAAFLPRMRPGAVLAGHDYSPYYHQGVKRAVDEIFGEENIVQVGTSWVKYL